MVEGDRILGRDAADVVAGDVINVSKDAYAAIQKKLWKWFFEETDEIFKAHNPKIPTDATLLLGCPVWSRKYLNRFMFLTLPSLMAPGNLPSFTKSKCHLLIYTDYKHLGPVRRELELLRHANVSYEVRLIPAEILKLVGKHEYNKFWVLGTVQNLCIQYARFYGMAFHMLMPDHVYSKNYFSQMAKLSDKHPVILQQSISADIDGAGPILASCLNGCELAVEAKGLADVSFYHMHPQIQPMMMNSRDVWTEISMSYYLLWCSHNSLRIYCPHVSLMFLSAEQVQKRSQAVLYNALDTVIPYFLEEGVEPYYPTVEDDMVFVELSDAQKRGYAYSIKFPEFCMRFWTVPHYEDHRYFDIFSHASTLPISENLMQHMMKREGRESMSEEAIDDQMHRIITALKNSQPRIREIKQAVDNEVFGEKQAA